MPTPDEIAGLQLWLKADAEAYSDNDPVDTWTDHSGNGLDAGQATGANQPIFETDQINGKPALSFDGATDLMSVPHDAAIDLDEDSTVFVVLKLRSTGSDSGIITKGASGVAGAYYLHTKSGDSKPVLDRPFVEGGVAATTGLGTSDWHYISVHVSGTTVSHFLDGAANGTDTLTTGTAATGTDMRIGCYDTSGADDFADVLIAEIIVYNVALSSTDREAVEDYLNTKYFVDPVIRIGRLYQVYAEIPGFDRTGRIHQLFFSIPEAARTGRIHQLFFSIPGFARVGRVFQVFGRVPSPPSGSGGPGGGDPGEEVVTDFVRQLAPIHSTAYERPRGKQSWGHTGKVQSRAGFSAGMKWTETYEPKRMTDPDFWGFVEYLNELQQNERLFEIALSDIMGRPTLLGTATGTMLVNGADQVGFSLAADGWSGTLKQGDLIRVAGLNYTMVVTADVTATNAIPISPGILSGGSPENDAEIFYGSNLTVRAKIDGLAMPEVDGDQVYAGLRVTFREAP